MIYVCDDFIYKTTLSDLYNFSPPWIQDLGKADMVVKSSYTSRKSNFLYYRPRVEAFALEHAIAYSHVVHLRVSRLRQADAVDEMIQRAEDAIIAPSCTIKTLDALIDKARKNAAYRIDRRKKSDLIAIETWVPTPADLLDYARTHLTNYLAILEQFWRTPGAGFAFLVVREKADVVAAEIVTGLGGVLPADLENDQ